MSSTNRQIYAKFIYFLLKIAFCLRKLSTGLKLRICNDNAKIQMYTNNIMELTKCDRCGKVYRGSKPSKQVGWIYGHIHTWDDVTNFDLCP